MVPSPAYGAVPRNGEFDCYQCAAAKSISIVP